MIIIGIIIFFCAILSMWDLKKKCFSMLNKFKWKKSQCYSNQIQEQKNKNQSTNQRHDKLTHKKKFNFILKSIVIIWKMNNKLK